MQCECEERLPLDPLSMPLSLAGSCPCPVASYVASHSTLPWRFIHSLLYKTTHIILVDPVLAGWQPTGKPVLTPACHPSVRCENWKNWVGCPGPAPACLQQWCGQGGQGTCCIAGIPEALIELG